MGSIYRFQREIEMLNNLVRFFLVAAIVIAIFTAPKISMSPGSAPPKSLNSGVAENLIS
jgi:hypothetical protein